MRHLFLTVHEIAFGEVLMGVRLAGELAAGGDEVLYLAPRAVAPALAGAPVRVGIIDMVVRAFDQVLARTVAETRADVVCLVDAMSTFAAFQHRGLDLGAILGLPVPVVALDVWDLPTAGLVVDFTAGAFQVDPRSLTLPRVVPVPFANPAAAGAYRALPAVNRGARGPRRAALGLAGDDKVILFPTATWQHREAAFPATRPLAEAVPPLLFAYARELGAKLLHVGPWRLPGAEALGDRYIHHPPAPRAVFEEMVSAADLLLSLNAAATTISTAIAARLPVLLAVHDHVPAAPGPIAARFLAGGPPLRPFRAWPYGMAAFIGRTLAGGNPYLDAVTSVELLDETALLAAARALLDDPAAADEARGRQERYAGIVAALPTGRERYLAAVSTARSASS
jgi:hypothetical protein